MSDLKAVRSKMEPGPYTHEPCTPPAGSVNIRVSRCTCDDQKEMCPQHGHIAEWVPLGTALGIEATHAAADTLIEIAVAALAWREAEQRRDEALRLMNAAENSDDYCAATTLLPHIGRDQDAALSRLIVALSQGATVSASGRNGEYVRRLQARLTEVAAESELEAIAQGKPVPESVREIRALVTEIVEGREGDIDGKGGTCSATIEDFAVNEMREARFWRDADGSPGDPVHTLVDDDLHQDRSHICGAGEVTASAPLNVAQVQEVVATVESV